MDELVFDAIDGNFHVHRQLPYETEDFGTSIQTILFEMLIGRRQSRGCYSVVFLSLVRIRKN